MNGDNRFELTPADERLLRQLDAAFLSGKARFCSSHEVAHARLMEDYSALHQNLEAADAAIEDRDKEIEGLAAQTIRLRTWNFLICLAAGFLALLIFAGGKP